MTSAPDRPARRPASGTARRGLRLLLAALLPAVATAAAAAGRAAGAGDVRRETPPRPPACADVEPGNLETALASAADGAALCLLPGRHPGSFTIRRRVTLWGPPAAVVASAGEGTTILIEAPGTQLLGFTMDGSGGRFDQLDAAVKVHADDVTVAGVRIQRALFGLLVEQARRATVRGCEIEGVGQGPLGLRGDGLRLWEARNCLLEANRVTKSRDVVVWYSPGNLLRRNVVEDSRYGTHFMYSADCTVEGATYSRDVVGVFIMYSRGVTVRDSVLSFGTGAAGMGVGLKECGNVTVERNVLARDTTGIYVDTSPQQVGDANTFRANAILACDVGVAFHSSEHDNTLDGNLFRGNQLAVRVDGGGDALGVTWRGNCFDDYAGYDLDGDGVGDVPYQLEDFSGALESRHPELALFHGSATLGLLDMASRAFPLLRPPVILVDARPTLHPGPEVPDHAR